MLQSDLCDYSDVYIVVEGTITFADPNDANYKKKLTFKYNSLFISSFISKISNTLIDNEEDLDIIVPMYKLLSTAKIKTKKQKKPESFWNYYRDE